MKVLFIAGPHGAGKTHASKEIESKGFVSIDLGPTIRRLHKESGTEDTLGEWITKNEALHGSSFSDDLLLEELNKVFNSASTSPDIKGLIVLGSRSYKNIQHLSKGLPASAEGNKILYIEASQKVLK